MQTHRLKIIVLKENKNQKRTEKRSKSKNELTQHLSTSSISLSLSSVLQSRRWEEKLIENRGTIAWVRLWVRRAAQRIPLLKIGRSRILLRRSSLWVFSLASRGKIFIRVESRMSRDRESCCVGK